MSSPLTEMKKQKGLDPRAQELAKGFPSSRILIDFPRSETEKKVLNQGVRGAAAGRLPGTLVVDGEMGKGGYKSGSMQPFKRGNG